MLSNHRLSRILRESINRVLNEDVNTASPSPRIAKIYDKVQQASMQLHGKSLIDKSSTWQVPFTVEYDVKYTNRGYLKVTRVETEETVYNNSGSAYNANKSVNTWLITDKNYKEKLKDDYTGEGLYDMLKYDLKCAKAYEREYATLGESVINRADIVQESANIENFSETEDIPTFEVINKNLSLSEIRDVLESYLYDKNDKFVGRLCDLHFKYDVNKNKTLGSNPI